MKPTIQLKVGQQLTISPQLKYAIKLLQLSKLELDLEIYSAVESNPMLETYEDSTAQDESSNTNDIENLPITSAWEEPYYNNLPTSSYTNQKVEIDSFTSAPETLQDHLKWQLNLTTFSDNDLFIAETIIDSIADNGYLSCELSEIQDSLNTSVEEIETVLHRIQQFEPIGVASRNLQECLQIQLNNLPPNTPYLKDASLIVKNHLDLLARKKYTELEKKLNLNKDELKAIIDFLTNLTPRPGDIINTERDEYVIPDVIVTKQNNHWVVKLNKDLIPKIKINSKYVSMIKDKDSSEDNNFLTTQLNEAKWLLKSLYNRNETLLKVASCIVKNQKPFLKYGEKAMQPLILQDIAKQVDLHESTISRITTKKYIYTPQGVYELKYFFSSYVKTSSGKDCSSTAIKAIIKNLIAEENADSPLSDSKIAEILSSQGINVARRTIAKYRELMSIPPSNQRKTIYY